MCIARKFLKIWPCTRWALDEHWVCIRWELGEYCSEKQPAFLLGWPWKTIGHLFYASSSFVQHFVPVGEFKLELQSGNAQSGSNLMIFRVVRPWNLPDDLAKQQGTSSMLLQALCIMSYPSVNSNWSYSPETLNSGQNRLFSLAVWPRKFKDDPQKQLCTHWWIQTEFTVRKRPIWVKFDDSALWPWNLTDDLEKQ